MQQAPQADSSRLPRSESDARTHANRARCSSWRSSTTITRARMRLLALALLALALPALLGGRASPATGAALQGPTTNVLDNFNRATEDPLFQWGHWEGSVDGAGPTLEVLGNAAGHNEGSTAGDSYRPATVSGDSEAHATLSDVPGNNAPMYLYLHLGDLGGAGWDGYRLRIERWVSTTPDTVAIQKVSNGTATTLVSSSLAGPSDLQTGDGYLLRRSGSALTLWRRNAGTWSQLLSTSDSAYGSGRIGLGVADDSGRWDDFGGSGPAAGPPPNLPVPLTNVIDDFERPDEDPLSQAGGWASSPLSGSGQTAEVLSGRAGLNEGATTPGHSYRSADTAGHAEVYATMSAPENNAPMYLYLHLGEVGGPGWDGYRAFFEKWIQSTPDTAAIQKVVDGQATTLVSTGLGNPDLSDGQVWLLRRLGNGLELWRKNAGTWAKVVSTADVSFTQGRLGLGFADDSGRWDDFGGGAFSIGPPLAQSRGVCSGRGLHAIATSRCLSDPVNTLSGAFIHQVDDLSTPGTGISFAWSRSYTSEDPTVGRLGPGWTDSYATSLLIQGNGDVILHGDEGQQVYYTKQGDGSFVGAAGALSTLSAIAGGYKLVRSDQVEYLFDSQGRLTSLKDRNAQGLTFAYDGQGRLATITDVASRQVALSYNASNLVSQVSTPAADGRSASYGYTSGRLTSVTDVRGKVWTYTYDAGGRLEKVIDPLNHAQVTNVYAADGRVQSQTDAVGKQTTFAWNASTQTATVTDARQSAWTEDYADNVLVSQVDPTGRTTSFGHADGDLNNTSVTSPTSQQTTMTYDAAGNLLTATAPPSLGANVQKTFVYNARNDPTSVTDAKNKVTSYTYTSSGNVESVTQDGVQVAFYTYDPQGRVLTTKDGNQKTTTYTYDANGNLASSTDPLGNTTTYTYWPDGTVKTRVDPKGNVAGCGCAADFTWNFTYNPAGQLLTETNPLGHVATTNVYDDAGRLSSTTDARGNTTSSTYDDANRVLTETRPDPDGGGPLAAPVTTYTYDNVGNKATETDALGRVTSFTYGPSNFLTFITGPDPDGAGPLAAPVTRHTYDLNGNLESTIEPRGMAAGANSAEYQTIYTFDAAGRQLTETKPDPDGTGPGIAPVTTNTYDAVGNLASVKDAKNRTTAYTYDAAGRILTVTAPNLGVTTYTYDGAGNVLTRRDDKQHVTTWVYDDAGRLSSETKPDPDGGGPQTSPLTTYTYDPNGNRLTLTDPNGNATGTAGDGVTTYGYDRANRQTSVDYADATPDVAFAYDNAGNRTQMTDGAGMETRTYDNLDRLKTVTRGSDTFSYTYDPVGNVTQRTYPGQSPIDYTYDGLDRMSTVSNAGATSYGYDIASNQTSATHWTGQVETRVYDRIGRLTEVKTEKAGVVQGHFVSTLDPVGNPTQVVRTGTLSETQTYTYDANDRLTGVCFQAGTCPGSSDPYARWTYDKVGNRLTEQTPTQNITYYYNALDQVTSIGFAPWTYDQNGNHISRGDKTYTYDQANRLKTSTIPPTTTSYSYDGEGVRLQASTGPGASEKTNFLWDKNHGLPQLALERDGANALLRRYTYGVRLNTMVAGSTTSFYHYDPLGSVASITGGAGNTRWTYSYEPFGGPRSEQQGAGTQPANFMRFTGEYRDPTGFYHLRARQYDPTWGRFMRPDPIDADRDSPFVAAYVYAANRPTVLIDPSGERFRPSNLGQWHARFVTRPAGVPWPIIVEGGDLPYFSNCRQEPHPCVRPAASDFTVRDGIELGLLLVGGGGTRIVAGIVATRAAVFTARVAPAVRARTKVVVKEATAIARSAAEKAAFKITITVGAQVEEFSDCLRELRALVAQQTPVTFLSMAITCADALARGHAGR